MSSLQRHFVNHYAKLTAVLRVEKRRPVSRSQLPRILEKIAVEVFDDLIFSHFGVKLTEKERQWFAVNGKTLRRSIERGAKRGGVLVQARPPEQLSNNGTRLLLRKEGIGSFDGAETIRQRR